MKTLLSAYLWCYDKPELADISFKKYREFYKDGNIYCKMDIGGNEAGFKKVCEKWGAKFSINPIHVGRCGYMGHYENYKEKGEELKRECWPKENAFTWLDGIYDACVDCNSKFLIVLEDDTFILKPISILNSEFGIAVHEYNTNILPNFLIDFINQIGGNTNIPKNIFGNKGYGGGGGFIVDCEKFVKSWDYFKPILDVHYDAIKVYSKLIGWCDCISQLVLMAGGHDVVMNKPLIATWYWQRPDLFPGFTNWEDYEIVDFLKDTDDINRLL